MWPKYPNYTFHFNTKFKIVFQNTLKDQNSLRDGFMPKENDLKASSTSIVLALTSHSEGICSWGFRVRLDSADAQRLRAVFQVHWG